MPSERTIYFSLTLESKTSKLSPEYSPLDEAEKLFISTVNFGISAKGHSGYIIHLDYNGHIKVIIYHF